MLQHHFPRTTGAADGKSAAAVWEQRAGYATVRSTRPQTLAYALTDSALGLLA